MEAKDENNKDALMVQVVIAFAQGCGGMEVSDGACAWFHGEYYDWIDTPRHNEKAAGRSPQDVWNDEKETFINHFQEIGKRAAAASSSGPVLADTLEKEAHRFYGELKCPWCPDK
jgi:hypothetical protein